MKRIIRCVLVVVLCQLLLAGCRYSNHKEQRDDIPEFVFTYAENQSLDYPTTQGAQYFADQVNKRSNGKIEIIVNAEGVLGDEKSVIEQLQFGGIDFARVSLSPLSEFIPKLNVLQLPYIYNDSEHFWRVLGGDIGNEFLNAFQGSDMIALSWYDAGARNFYNTVRPISSPKDMKGLRIRVQQSDLMIDMVKLLGAEAEPIIYKDVYSGLLMGEFDGAENNFPSYESTKHYEVARYYTVDEHTRVPEVQLCSQATWDKLSKEYQDIIRQCAKESSDYERKLWSERERISEEKVRKSGTEIIELTAEEKSKFQRTVFPLYEKFCSQYMDIVNRIIEEGKNK